MASVPRPVEVHLFAAARSAAGVKLIEVPAGTLGEVLVAAVGERPGLGPVLERCSTLVDGIASSDLGGAVPPGGRVDVLPPFAGG
ncbi:MAG: MoaD/ThiS family protein [Candidatus Nanopelagicales bacterium]